MKSLDAAGWGREGTAGMGPGTVLRPRPLGRTGDTGVAAASAAYPSCFRNQLDRSARGSSVRGRNAFNVVSGARCVWDVVRSQAIGRTSFCAEWRVTVGTGAAAIITAWCLVGLGGFNCWRVAGMLCYALVRSACTFLGSVVESSGGAFWLCSGRETRRESIDKLKKGTWRGISCSPMGRHQQEQQLGTKKQDCNGRALNKYFPGSY